MIVDIVKGSANAKIKSYHLDRNPAYGSLKDSSRNHLYENPSASAISGYPETE